MQVRIDFQLNHRFGVPEKIVFGLVMHGFTNAREIFLALPIFSDAVIANAIRNLVNQQILSADVETGTLFLSDPVVAVIEMCFEKSFDIDIPDSLMDVITNDGLLLKVENGMPELLKKKVNTTKEAILQEMLPDIKLDMLLNSLDFIIKQDRGVANE